VSVGTLDAGTHAERPDLRGAASQRGRLGALSPMVEQARSRAPSSRGRRRRCSRRRLGSGGAAAPERESLALLPSGPDAVRTLPVRGTRSVNTTCADPVPTSPPLGRRSVPRGADFGFREPLTPHLARPGGSMVAAVASLSARRASRVSWTPLGRIAQRESARFTRERSLVRSQVRPLSQPPVYRPAFPQGRARSSRASRVRQAPLGVSDSRHRRGRQRQPAQTCRYPGADAAAVLEDGRTTHTRRARRRTKPATGGPSRVIRRSVDSCRSQRSVPHPSLEQLEITARQRPRPLILRIGSEVPSQRVDEQLLATRNTHETGPSGGAEF
jgi:hypothetical protein